LVGLFGGKVRDNLAPHQLRDAHALKLAREGVPSIVIERQFEHLEIVRPRNVIAREKESRVLRDPCRAQRLRRSGADSL
jgi:hypothetical protein